MNERYLKKRKGWKQRAEGRLGMRNKIGTDDKREELYLREKRTRVKAEGD